MHVQYKWQRVFSSSFFRKQIGCFCGVFEMVVHRETACSQFFSLVLRICVCLSPSLYLSSLFLASLFSFFFMLRLPSRENFCFLLYMVFYACMAD